MVAVSSAPMADLLSVTDPLLLPVLGSEVSRSKTNLPMTPHATGTVKDYIGTKDLTGMSKGLALSRWSRLTRMRYCIALHRGVQCPSATSGAMAKVEDQKKAVPVSTDASTSVTARSLDETDAIRTGWTHHVSQQTPSYEKKLSLKSTMSS